METIQGNTVGIHTLQTSLALRGGNLFSIQKRKVFRDGNSMRKYSKYVQA